MKRFPILMMVMMTAFLSASAFSEPTNLGLHKIELEHYFDSGRYLSDISKRIREAKYYLRFRITQNKRLRHPRKLAMVLDVDESALSNYEDIKRFQFGGTPEEIQAANADGHDTVIRPTLSLFNLAVKNGVAVFFIAGRKQYEYPNTATNLHNAGYNRWDGLFLEPNHYNKASAIPFKVASRKRIIEMGYDIVLDVGDQYSDLKGGYADMLIKLPNPFYYLS